MSKPKVFIGSTYTDLHEIRSVLSDFFEDIGFEAKIFERGGMFYDPSQALDQSGYREVRDSDLFVLIIGGKYGNKSTENANRNPHNYNSITKAEYQTARDANIPLYTFVESNVHAELHTYRGLPRETRKNFQYAHVDNIQVFLLLEDIYNMKKGNPIFRFETSSDIVRVLKSQLAGVWSEYFKDKRQAMNREAKVRINAYKLFFLRSQEHMSFTAFSKKTGVSKDLLRKLEKVNKKYESLEPNMFSLCDRSNVDKIEDALNCKGFLRVGRNDDFLSIYMQYYAAYKGPKCRHAVLDHSDIALFPSKAVVFDFDGTLTSQKEDVTTWERIWIALGYDINDCSRYHRQFSEKKITHKKWCDITRDKFRGKNLNEKQLRDISRTIELLPGTREVITQLYANNIKMYILSGSIRQIIKHVLGDLYELFEDVRANDLLFDSYGRIRKIKGTAFDFEGKAEYLKKVITDNDLSPLEVLFVGNSCNDIYASRSGARTLCINPRFTDPNNIEHWSYCLRKAHDLRPILDYIKLPSIEERSILAGAQ